MSKWKIAGINFDHMHMGDLLRMAYRHPEAEIVGISDGSSERMEPAIRKLDIPRDRVFTDYRECLERTRPDLVILCPATADHREWVERVAPFGTHLLLEKPFASNLADADAMIEAVSATGRTLAVNWPLAWYPVHVTSKRLLDEGIIGEPLEVHYYDGNRGPLFHVADKDETGSDNSLEEKRRSWWYQRASGGGSRLDYLGYGATLGTWFMNGAVPLEIVSMSDRPAGLEVDEHSVTIARYATGLSKFETRWGTFSDPWTHQPQPKCGFVIVGTQGNISSYDFEKSVRIQTRDFPEGREIPVDELQSPFANPIQYLLDCIAHGRRVEGPLSPRISRIGQRMVDSAVLSALKKKTVPLLG